MKRIVLILGALVLILGATAQAQLKATGPATWEDTVAGTYHGAFGPGGKPTLCYQKADGEWDFIVDDWVRVGQRQIWKSVRGNHRVFVDSTGAAIYAKGNHYLGTKTTHLIKFDKSDSTWQLLKASLPDSLTTHGRTVTFHGIFPGVDKRLTNNAKFFRQYAETFIFHQEARDSLAQWGPWAGYLLGTATRLNTDSLNLTLRDAAGVFGIDATGRMVDKWVRAEDNGLAVFHIGTAHLHTEDSLVQSIPVRKWLVHYAGSPWLIELFNPVVAAALPDGDIWHRATFGYTTGFDGSPWSLANKYLGCSAVPSSSGTADSINIYLEDNGAVEDHRAALYDYDVVDSNMEQIDTTAEISVDITNFEWVTFILQNSQSITANESYLLLGWGGDDAHDIQYRTGGVDTLVYRASQTYVGNTWEDPLGACTHYENYDVAIYCWYTESGPPEGNLSYLRRVRLLKGK